ncbi:helix-turn-helix domain-containing protein [Erysipelothrix aquatica]|uniref:helix-turn-helix domain-containing protein n=1 Tax=Erysipelothrix aquatica TaxID=2683714 RepID=UPI0013582AF3|nr:helix-turn-helix transcriptional regulator [Erysipelothrix aquatica]
MIDSKRIKVRMIELDISQRELARSTGVGLNHINEVINNKVSPRLELVDKISIALNLGLLEKREIFLP